MSKLTILVDMDDVLENLCEVWVEQLNTLFQLDVKADEIEEWDMSKAFPTLTKDEIYWPLHTEMLWTKVKPLPGAVKYIKKLINEGHKIIVVTAASAESVQMKLENVLFKYFPFLTMDDVIVATQKWLIRGDVMVDDAPHNLKNFFGEAILFTAPHNRNFDDRMYGMTRVNNWDEAYKTIQKIAQEDENA